MKTNNHNNRVHEGPSSQEHHLASVMLRRELGHIATYDGASHVTQQEFGQLVDQFRHDPKESLAYARETLFELSADKNLDEATKEQMVDEYLDSYFDLTIRMDRAAFPETNQIHQGVPEYIPDGYVDMGTRYELHPVARKNREQMWVDKRNVFAQNKDALKHLVMNMPRDADVTTRKQVIVKYFSELAHTRLRQGAGYADNSGGNKVKLSEMTEGICRHQSMMFQVLTQAMGVQSRLVKCSMNGIQHVANTIRIDGQWYLMDVANPDYAPDVDGKKKWNMGLVKIDAPHQLGEDKQYDVTFPKSGDKRTYVTNDKTFWRVEHS